MRKYAHTQSHSPVSGSRLASREFNYQWLISRMQQYNSWADCLNPSERWTPKVRFHTSTATQLNLQYHSQRKKHVRKYNPTVQAWYTFCLIVNYDKNIDMTDQAQPVFVLRTNFLANLHYQYFRGQSADHVSLPTGRASTRTKHLLRSLWPAGGPQEHLIFIHLLIF